MTRVVLQDDRYPASSAAQGRSQAPTGETPHLTWREFPFPLQYPACHARALRTHRPRAHTSGSASFSSASRLCIRFGWHARSLTLPAARRRVCAAGGRAPCHMRRARLAVQRARAAHGVGGVCWSTTSVASPRARLSTPAVVPFALAAAALPRGVASSGACWHRLRCQQAVTSTCAGTPPGVTLATTLQQQLTGVAAQLRAVDSDIRAARAAGEADEVRALREKEKLLTKEKGVLLEVLLNLLPHLRGPDNGACLLLASPGSFARN